MALTCKECGTITYEIKTQDVDGSGWCNVGWSRGAGWRGICPQCSEKAEEEAGGEQ